MSIFVTLLFTNVSNNVTMKLNACEHAGSTMTNVQSIVLVMPNAPMVALLVIDMMVIHAKLGFAKINHPTGNGVFHKMKVAEILAMQINRTTASRRAAVGVSIGTKKNPGVIKRNLN